MYTRKKLIEWLIPYVGTTAKFSNYEGYERDEELTLEKLLSADLSSEECIQPYLKPLAASKYGAMADALHKAWEETKEMPYDEIQVVCKFAKTVSLLRWLGYDCDGLIEKGVALIHPNYDITDIL